ncbi:MAG: hypothetical protein QW390_01290 [Candidatus Bathyarchaeia archaeon]
MGERSGRGSGRAPNDKASLLELIDNLIAHVNSERGWFNALTLSSVIAAPVSLFFTALILFHPRILGHLLRLAPSLASILIIHLAVNLFLSALWLVIGVKEFKFLSRWNERFRAYFSLKEQLDRELSKEFEPERARAPR